MCNSLGVRKCNFIQYVNLNNFFINQPTLKVTFVLILVNTALKQCSTLYMIGVTYLAEE